VTNPFEPPSGEPAQPAPPPYATPPAYGQNPYGQSMPAYQPQPLYGQPAGSPYGGSPAAPRNGLGTTALVLGIIGAVVGLLMFLFFVVFVLGVLAVIFGLIGRGRAKRGAATNKTQATWGFALGVVSLALSIVGGIVTVHVVNVQRDCRDRAVNQQQYDDCAHKF